MRHGRLSGVRSFFILFPALLLGQTPTVGVIQIYGNSKVPAERIRTVLGVAEGEKLPASKGGVEERLEEVEGIVRARLEAACCEDGKVILYTGIEERDGPRFALRSAPTGELVLPDEITSAYRSFLQAAREASRTGQAAEDLSRGHSLLQHPAARETQLRFIDLASQNLDSIRHVLRESSNEEHRAIAAYVIGYASDKAEVIDDVQYALQDPDETVRANAIRAVAALAVYANKNPGAKLNVSPTWLIEMLNSVVWTDRNNAAVALVTLTETRDPGVLTQLRTQALPSLMEMAAWRHLPHALPAYILLGRALGVPEKELQEAWSKGDREKIIRRASSNKKQAPLGHR
jgi:hypothetical protein